MAADVNQQLTWGPFLERPGNLTGPISYFEIKFSRRVESILFGTLYKKELQ